MGRFRGIYAYNHILLLLGFVHYRIGIDVKCHLTNTAKFTVLPHVLYKQMLIVTPISGFRRYILRIHLCTSLKYLTGATGKKIVSLLLIFNFKFVNPSFEKRSVKLLRKTIFSSDSDHSRLLQCFLTNLGTRRLCVNSLVKQLQVEKKMYI